MDFKKRADELFSETVSHRRYLHKNAECGLHLPKTVEYVKSVLDSLGIKHRDCAGGVIGEIGEGEKTVLLRADMDALPMKEESGLEFSSATDCAHTCGHELHTAMLLCAAKMISEARPEGKVILMFQPAEETLEGAKAMISEGLFETSRPQAAFALHVAGGKCPVGTVLYNAGKTMMRSCHNLRFKIKGKGGHGAYPDMCVNPLDVATELCQRMKELNREDRSLTVCKISGGSTYNIIPEYAEIEGGIRADSEEALFEAMKKIEKVCKELSDKFGAKVLKEELSGTPPLICDKALSEAFAELARKRGYETLGDMKANASEDFAYVAKEIPSVMMYVGAGFSDERGEAAAHDPRVIFNEDVLPIGSALLAEMACNWLKGEY